MKQPALGSPWAGFVLSTLRARPYRTLRAVRAYTQAAERALAAGYLLGAEYDAAIAAPPAPTPS